MNKKGARGNTPGCPTIAELGAIKGVGQGEKDNKRGTKFGVPGAVYPGRLCSAGAGLEAEGLREELGLNTKEKV